MQFLRSIPTTSSSAGVLLALYLTLVRLLRYRRRNNILRKYGYCSRRHNRQVMASMTLDEASAIQREIAQLEFPTTFERSLGFAILKTYGIPSISRLLVATRQLAEQATVSKRAADTGVIMSEIIYNTPGSPRNIDGIARMNFLHSRYRHAGRISDADMLYTLSMFALEPVRWIARFEWRPLSDVEMCAMVVYWRDMGEIMGIPYGALEEYIHVGDDEEHEDGLAWLDALDAWSREYERKYMVPAETNKKLGWRTLELVVMNTPGFLRNFSLKVASASLEPRLRTALMIDEPSQLHFAVLYTMNIVRRWALHYLTLPRPRWAKRSMFTDEPDAQTGKYHRTTYITHPWYVKPTLLGRWGPRALWLRLIGSAVPGDEGSKYAPEGYAIPELGPDALKGKGQEEMSKERVRISEFRSGGGCPMASL